MGIASTPVAVMGISLMASACGTNESLDTASRSPLHQERDLFCRRRVGLSRGSRRSIDVQLAEHDLGEIVIARGVENDGRAVRRLGCGVEHEGVATRLDLGFDGVANFLKDVIAHAALLFAE